MSHATRRRTERVACCHWTRWTFGEPDRRLPALVRPVYDLPTSGPLSAQRQDRPIAVRQALENNHEASDLMANPCSGHACDHCFICDHVGVCCGSLTQSEKFGLVRGRRCRGTPALQGRLAELRRQWGGTSRPLARNQARVVVRSDEEPFDFGSTRPTALPALGNLRALPAPAPVIDPLIDKLQRPAEETSKERYL